MKVLKDHELVKLLRSNGYERCAGTKHFKFKNASGKTIIVPIGHKSEVSGCTLRGILKDAGIRG